MGVWLVSQLVAIAMAVIGTTYLLMLEKIPPPVALFTSLFWAILVRSAFAAITLAGITSGGFRDTAQRHAEVEGYIVMDCVAGGLVALGIALGAGLWDGGILVIVSGTGFLCFLLLWTLLLIGVISPRGAAAGAIRGGMLLATLRDRGYDWLSGEDARYLWQSCGEAAFKLPPWEMVGTLPGVVEGNVEALGTLVDLRHNADNRG